MIKAKKHKINSETNFSFFLIGISSSEVDYKLCWKINQELNLEFKKVKDLLFYHEKLNVEQNFSLYTFSNDEFEAYFISNKTTNGYLIDEHKKIDYFLKIESQNQTILDNLYTKLNQINFIQAVFKIDVNSLKSKQKLIFEIEE